VRGYVFICRQLAPKRDAGFSVTQLTTRWAGEIMDTERLTRLSEALDGLGALGSRLAEAAHRTYFYGFLSSETAAQRGASERTFQRDWEKARLLPYRQIGESDG
jgi:ECF sigma factor